MTLTTLYAHEELSAIGVKSLKVTSADGPGYTNDQNADIIVPGYVFFDEFAHPLVGITRLEASVQTVTYRLKRNKTGLTFNGDVVCRIRKSDGELRTTLGVGVAPSPPVSAPIDVWQTLTGTWNFNGYNVVDQTDFLCYLFRGYVTEKVKGALASMRHDDSALPLVDQVKIANIDLISMAVNLRRKLIGVGK